MYTVLLRLNCQIFLSLLHSVLTWENEGKARNFCVVSAYLFITLADRDLAWIALDLFFAGSQTTGDTIKFALYYLAVNPRAQEKLQAELDQTLDGTFATLEDRARSGHS